MEYSIGQKAEYSKMISESDVLKFAELTGDYNDMHISEIEASKSRFGKRVVHGAFVSSLISTVLGMKLPGPGTIYIEQNSKFLKPVYFMDTVTAVVSIVEINNHKATLRTQVVNQKGEIVLDGEAKVLLPN